MEKHCEVISLSISVGNVGIYLPVDPVVGPYFSEHSFHPMGNEMITEGCHFYFFSNTDNSTEMVMCKFCYKRPSFPNFGTWGVEIILRNRAPMFLFIYMCLVCDCP